MLVKQIIKEAMDKNPVGLKEALEQELRARVELALEAKMKKEEEEEAEDDDMDDEDEDDEDEDDEDEDDMEEEAQPKWKAKIGNKTYTVTARNTAEANKKAVAAAKKDGNFGAPSGSIEKVA
jgi:hypothetical protein